MKNILVLIGFVIIFGGVIVFIIISAIKRKEEVFEGVVIDKNIVEQRNTGGGPRGANFGAGGVTHEYKIKVKTDNGKEINYRISEGKYEIIKIGDRVSKPKGTTEVDIVSSSPQAAQSPQPTYNQGSPSLTPSPPIPPITPTPIPPPPPTPTPSTGPTQVPPTPGSPPVRPTPPTAV